MLRPPTIATVLSAMKDLLCMRRLSRRPSSRNWPTFDGIDGLRVRKRVEHANLDVLVRVERVEHLHRVREVDVVEQHAHAHAAIRRRQQALRQQAPGRVVLEDVVLQVDRVPGVVANATRLISALLALVRSRKPDCSPCRPSSDAM
jgi:hypothetical protein